MTTIQDTMTLIKDEFSIFNEPQEKYVLLIDNGYNKETIIKRIQKRKILENR